MLKVRHFEMSCQILAHLNFMSATHSKKVGTGSNKRPEKLNVHIRNSWRTNLQLIRSIGNMIGYKKSLSEWQCLSEVKMGRGSPIPPMLRQKIVEQYQKGVSQRKIAKSLKLSSSTVHNIIQRFRESGTISVRKGQVRKTILDARDLRALRRHCIIYRNATVMEITTWAQEYFQKTLSVNTIHRAIRRCRLKLYRSKKKPYLNMIQKRRRFLWAKAHLKWTVASGKLFCGQTNQNLKFFLENWDAMSSGLKRTRTTQVVISAQFWSLHLWWYGVAWVHVAWAAYTSGKAPSMLKGISKF